VRFPGKVESQLPFQLNEIAFALRVSEMELLPSEL